MELKVNAIYKLKIANQIYDNIENELMPESFMIKSLFDDKNIDRHIDAMMKIQKQILNFQNSISFQIIGSNSPYNNIFKDEISKKGFSFKNSSKSIKIHLSAKENKLKILRNYILQSTLSIRVRINNVLIYQKILKLAGKSRSNFKQAKEFALIEFQKKLNKDNILNNILGK